MMQGNKEHEEAVHEAEAEVEEGGVFRWRRRGGWGGGEEVVVEKGADKNPFVRSQ